MSEAVAESIELAHAPSQPEYSKAKNGRRLSKHQEQLILRLSDGSRSQRDVAEIVGCSQPTVHEVLERWSDTRQLAAKRLNAGADTLAARVVHKARPDVAVDVLERLGVVAPRKSDSRPNITVVFGDVSMTPVMPQLADTTEPSYVSPDVIDATPSPDTQK